MVQSQAESVDGYLAEVPEERREALIRLRELCRAGLQGFTEVMAYGMPAYERDGAAEVAFASQQQCISFYLMRSDVRDAFAERLAGQDMGKGCLRFRRPELIDFTLVRDLLKAGPPRARAPGRCPVVAHVHDLGWLGLAISTTRAKNSGLGPAGLRS